MESSTRLTNGRLFLFSKKEEASRRRMRQFQSVPDERNALHSTGNERRPPRTFQPLMRPDFISRPHANLGRKHRPMAAAVLSGFKSANSFLVFCNFQATAAKWVPVGCRPHRVPWWRPAMRITSWLSTSPANASWSPRKPPKRRRRRDLRWSKMCHRVSKTVIDSRLRVPFEPL